MELNGASPPKGGLSAISLDLGLRGDSEGRGERCFAAHLGGAPGISLPCRRGILHTACRSLSSCRRLLSHYRIPEILKQKSRDQEL